MHALMERMLQRQIVLMLKSAWSSTCPSIIAGKRFYGPPTSARIYCRPKADERCVVLAWPTSHDGRKLSQTALCLEVAATFWPLQRQAAGVRPNCAQGIKIEPCRDVQGTPALYQSTSRRAN